MLDKFLLTLIRLYQITLSPFFGRQCRFIPTCSNYAIEAIKKHGAVKGVYLAFFRILRCHPFGSSGYDPVPEDFHWKHVTKHETKY